MILYIDAAFLQISVWERFGAISPVLHEFEPVKTQRVVTYGIEREKTTHHKSVVKPEEERKPLSKIIDIGKSLNVRPYAYKP